MVQLLPLDAADKSVSWTSSNTKVAKVSNGVVTAVGAGNAVITVKSNNDKKDEINIEVKPSIERIEFIEESITMNKGDSRTISYTLLPENAYVRPIKWSSSDTNIVGVRGDKITAKGAGMAVISAIAPNGNETIMEIIVNPIVEKISIINNDTNLLKGDIIILSISIAPDNAIDKSVTWTSNDNEIVTVMDGKITALKSGSAVISVESYNKIKDSINITVYELVESIEIGNEDLTLKIDDEYILKTIISPKNAVVNEIKWNSEDSEIASVISDGTITARKAGTVIITVTTDNGKTDSVTITIEKTSAAPAIIGIIIIGGIVLYNLKFKKSRKKNKKV